MEYSSCVLGGIILFCKKVELVDQMEKKALCIELVSIASFTVCFSNYQQEELFNSFLAEIDDPSKPLPIASIQLPWKTEWNILIDLLSILKPASM